MTEPVGKTTGPDGPNEESVESVDLTSEDVGAAVDEAEAGALDGEASEHTSQVSDDADTRAGSDSEAEHEQQNSEDSAVPLSTDEQLNELKELVKERTEDLQRVRAEYVNYKKRVDRDRAVARQSGVEAVLRDLLPVFDSLTAADGHGELTGGFKLTGDTLTNAVKTYGLEAFGEPDDQFDPRLHEALMQIPDPDVSEMVIREVVQKGYRIGEQVVRPARVVVAVPAE